MKKIQITILLCFILIISSFSVLAETTYPYISGENSDFIQGTGFFNTDLTGEPTPKTVPINSPQFSPLVNDLDGDGINEIIVMDGVTLKLFHDSELTIVDGISLSSSGRPMLITFDIDGDNYTEVIIGSSNDNIIIVEYNGTDIYVQNTISLGSYKNDGDVNIQCGEIENCLVVYNQYDTSNYGTTIDINAIGFNSTALTTPELKLESHNGYSSSNRQANFCLPRIRNIQYKDYDRDSKSEYIFTYAETSILDGEKVTINYVYHNGTVLTKEKAISRSSNVFSRSGYPFTCSGIKSDRFFTDPLVFEFDGLTGNGLETVIGLHYDNDEFRMYSYYATGTELNTYPEVLGFDTEADGEIISNLMYGNVFYDSPASDVCVLGYDPIDSDLDLLCASEQSGYFADSEQFYFDYQSLDNLTGNYMETHSLSHFGQHTSDLTSGVNLNELITSVGVFKIDYAGIDELELIYSNPYHPSTLLSVDVEQSGREDLLALSSTNLWYIDDGYSNTNGEISEVCFNPCIDATIKQNSTLSVTVTAVDIDSDNVATQVTAYEGTIYENVSNWTTYYTSGTTMSHTFELTNQIGTGNILIESRDDFNPNITDSQEVSFSVGSNGVEYGDSNCCYDYSTTIDEDANATTTYTPDEQEVVDDLTNGILGRDENGEGGISDGYLPIISLIGLILLMFIGTEVGKSQLGLDSGHAIMLGLSVTFIGFFFFTWIGWLPTWVTVIAVIMSIGVISFELRDKLNGNSGGI